MTDTYHAADLPFSGSPVVPEMSDGNKQIQSSAAKASPAGKVAVNSET